MCAKEYKFLSTVKVASDVATKYPNYKINGFTPKTLAKRLISGNSEKGNMRDFGFEYKTIPLNPIQKLFVVQEVVDYGTLLDYDIFLEPIGYWYKTLNSLNADIVLII